MYNFALAFVLCAAVYIIGEVVSTATKAWIPSVFVTAAIILVGYWTVLPTTLISDAVLIPFGSTIGIYLLITHMGTVISIKQLWSSAASSVCLAGLAVCASWHCSSAPAHGPQLCCRGTASSAPEASWLQRR